MPIAYEAMWFRPAGASWSGRAMRQRGIESRQGLGVERLNPDRPGVAGEFREQGAGQVGLHAGTLQLRIDADPASGGAVEAIDQFEDLCQARHAERRVGIAVRSGLDDVQLLDLREGEVGRVVAAVGARPIGVQLGDVRGAIQGDVVQGDGDAVGGQHDVRLDPAGALSVRERVGGQRVLRQVARRAAVGDDLHAGILSPRLFVGRRSLGRRSRCGQNDGGAGQSDNESCQAGHGRLPLTAGAIPSGVYTEQYGMRTTGEPISRRV